MYYSAQQVLPMNLTAGVDDLDESQILEQDLFCLANASSGYWQQMYAAAYAKQQLMDQQSKTQEAEEWYSFDVQETSRYLKQQMLNDNNVIAVVEEEDEVEVEEEEYGWFCSEDEDMENDSVYESSEYGPVASSYDEHHGRYATYPKSAPVNIPYSPRELCHQNYSTERNTALFRMATSGSTSSLELRDCEQARMVYSDEDDDAIFEMDF